MVGASELPTSSTLRAFRLIELIANAETPLSLDEVTQRSGLPKPTVYRTLGMLVRSGLASRDSVQKRYGVGPRLSALALKAQLHAPERTQRQAVLARLAEETGESCNLAVLDGTELVDIDRVEGRSPVGLHADLGSRRPLHCTASGKLYLSQLTPAKVRVLLGREPFKRYTERTLTDFVALERELRKTRAERVGTDVGEYIEGIACLAVPVTDARGRVRVTVAVRGPALRLTARNGLEHLPALRRAAAAMAAVILPLDGEAAAARDPAWMDVHTVRGNDAAENAWRFEKGRS